MAAFIGHADTVAFLLKKGADVNAEDKQGTTALSMANQSSIKSIEDMLLNAGAVQK